MYILKKSKRKTQKKSKTKKSKTKQSKSRKSLQKSPKAHKPKSNNVKKSKHDNKLDFDKIVKTLDRDLQQIYVTPPDNKNSFNFPYEFDEEKLTANDIRAIKQDTDDDDELELHNIEKNIPKKPERVEDEKSEHIESEKNISKKHEPTEDGEHNATATNLNVNNELKLKYNKLKLDFLE